MIVSNASIAGTVVLACLRSAVSCGDADMGLAVSHRPGSSHRAPTGALRRFAGRRALYLVWLGAKMLVTALRQQECLANHQFCRYSPKPCDPIPHEYPDPSSIRPSPHFRRNAPAPCVVFTFRRGDRTALSVSAISWTSVVLFFASTPIRQAYRRARRSIDPLIGAFSSASYPPDAFALTDGSVDHPNGTLLVPRWRRTDYLIPNAMLSGPARCPARVVLKPAGASTRRSRPLCSRRRRAFRSTCRGSSAGQQKRIRFAVLTMPAL